MDIRHAFATLAVALIATAASWLYLHPESVPRSLRERVPGATTAELHKCMAAGKVSYSSDKCPAGSQEASLTGGTLTVMPAAAAAPASAASLPTVRDLLGPAGGADLQEKRIERAIGN